MRNMELFSDFEENISSPSILQVPLAERMRPKTKGDFIDQENIIDEGKLIPQLVEQEFDISIILWGPPGSEKNTIAHIISHRKGSHFHGISVVNSGIVERKVIASSKNNVYGGSTILFNDETHRFDNIQYSFGVNYKYPYNYPDNHVEQEYLPKQLRGKKYISNKAEHQKALIKLLKIDIH